MTALPTLTAVRYVTPLRQGGSLPAVVETEGEGLFVVKFVGAGQGPKALIAELIAGEIGRTLGLRVPELALVQVESGLGSGEANPEIRQLLLASVGVNLGLRFIPNALEYNPLLKPPPPPEDAAAIVWFDAYVTNVDRTARNVNILLQGLQLWLIDHGASLYFHHSPNWWQQPERSLTPFTPVKNHVLLPFSTDLREADAALKPRLTATTIDEIVNLIPDEWLNDEAPADIARGGYVDWLLRRLDSSEVFVDEANNARAKLL